MGKSRNVELHLRLEGIRASHAQKSKLVAIEGTRGSERILTACDRPSDEQDVDLLTEHEQELVARFYFLVDQVGCESLATALLVISVLSNFSQPDKLLTPAELGKQSRSSAETVIGWIRAGFLRASNLSNSDRPRFLVQRESFIEFLAKREVVVNVTQHATKVKQNGPYRRFSAG